VPKTLETLRDWLDAEPREREDALEMCLRRIRASDAQIRAWVQVSPQRPIAEGPLYLVPFGVKDVFETEGLVTEFGSPVYKGRKGTADAALVRELRSRGAVLLGKTHTAAFAYRAPAPTRNPQQSVANAGRQLQRLSSSSRRRGWCLSLWEQRLGGPFCDQHPTVA
jgi:Asp-tRNA(Asn)/Glu-tRNA(Gln) amidotransferase A subunit family amidase